MYWCYPHWTDLIVFVMNRVLDPLLNGDYPPEMYRLLGENMPKFSPDELKKIKGSIDFIGINHYSSLYAENCSYSPSKLGCQAIKGFVYTTGERDGVPIGEEVSYLWTGLLVFIIGFMFLFSLYVDGFIFFALC